MNDSFEDSYAEFCRKGREALASQNLERAELEFLNAWNLIPEPKHRHENSQTLSAGLVKFFRDSGQFAKAKKWLVEMEMAYGQGNHYVELLKGSVFFEAGELDEAFNVLDPLYQKFGKRPFTGSDRKYYDFIADRRKNKPAKIVTKNEP